ncbi:unnamed protein product [Chilo suppressalis]|uniref:Lipocalin/cytosolic fatty-acid binding domain-containing protein n=1 Tax=Chilo suppressalis TaxID=168631 RepID=A0ABN8B4U8_CHISP|nr:hypothetical protein evm_001555 [Chilo suppressalis]CAH0400612.1 unnamed protein product [Chilo suppressalis]
MLSSYLILEADKEYLDSLVCAKITSGEAVTMGLTLIVFYVTIIAIINHVNCQMLNFGPCPIVETVNFFDIERFLGSWYVIERYPTWYEDGQCSHKRFEACGRRIEIEHVFIREGVQFVLQVNSSYNPGDEAVFQMQDNIIERIGIPIEVVATDYSEHALLYGCKYHPYHNIKYTLAWILSRNQTLPEQTINDLKTTFNKIPYSSLSFLERVRHDSDICAHSWTAHVENNDIGK